MDEATINTENEKFIKEMGLSSEIYLRMKEKYLFIQLLLPEGNTTRTREQAEQARDESQSLLNLVERSISAEKKKDIRVVALITFFKMVHLKIDVIGTGLCNDEENENIILRKIKRFHGDNEAAIRILKASPITISTALFIFIESGYVLNELDDYEESMIYLKEAEYLYNTFKASSYNGSLFVIAHLFNLVDHPKSITLQSYAISLYYLMAIAYFHTNAQLKSADYAFNSLELILLLPEPDMGLWFRGLTALIEIYTKLRCISQVNYTISVAKKVVENYKNKIINDKKEKEKSDVTDELHVMDTLIGRIAAETGLAILEMSANNLSKQNEPENKVPDAKRRAKKERLQKLKFKNLKFEVEVEEILPVKVLHTFDDAKPVFLKVMKWLEEVKNVNTMEKNSEIHVLVVKKMAKAYTILTVFEKEMDRKAKMLKRKIDLLEELKNKLPKDAKLLESVYYDLGESYEDILRIKCSIFCKNEGILPQAGKKINKLKDSAVENFKLYLERYPDEENLSLLIKDILLAVHVKLGILHTIVVTNDVQVLIENLEKSLIYFKYVDERNDENNIGIKGFHAVTMSQNFLEVISECITRYTLLPTQYNAYLHLCLVCSLFGEVL